MFDVLTTSVSIMEKQITAMRLATDPPDLLIQPDLRHVRLLEFNRAKQVIAEGYSEAKSRIDAWVREEG